MRATKILVECPELIASVRVGVLEPLKPLIESNKCEVEFKRTADITNKDIAWCDTLICVRGCEPLTLKIVKEAKKAGRFIIYFLDDDLLNIPKNISCSRYFENKSVKESLISILSYSDINWCVNNLIAEKYKKYSKGNWILSKVPTISKNYNDKIDDTNIINVLYAGSKDHTDIIREYISPAILRLNDEFDNVKYTFIGADPNLCELENVKFIRYFDTYDEYKLFVEDGNFKIGLAPINTDDFYCCKYYNKFIEYTSIGSVGIYTNSKPYTLIIQDELNGFLCDNTVEHWYNTIKKVLLNTQLRDKNLNIAKKIILTDFSYKDVSEKLENSINELTSFYAKEINYKQIKLNNSKFVFYIGRLKILWQNYGLKIVLVLPYKIYKKIIRFK